MRLASTAQALAWSLVPVLCQQTFAGRKAATHYQWGHSRHLCGSRQPSQGLSSRSSIRGFPALLGEATWPGVSRGGFGPSGVSPSCPECCLYLVALAL